MLTTNNTVLFMRLSTQAGFSLIELMTVTIIIGIAAGIAIPSLTSFLQTSQQKTIQSEFQAAMALARSEAIKRNFPVSVVANAPVAGNAFGGGWTVWADLNSNGVIDPGESIRVHAALPTSVTLNGPANIVTFNGKGFLNPLAAVQLKVCPAPPTSRGYLVTIQANGLADVAPNTPCP
jgi:type IV fimbrial biogenesis protein FimT